jgi:hypothetical protein
MAIYIDPLGGKTDISGNNFKKLKNSIKTINARVEDSKLQHQTHYLHLSIWSVTTGISIIVLLILLRRINKK